VISEQELTALLRMAYRAVQRKHPARAIRVRRATDPSNPRLRRGEWVIVGAASGGGMRVLALVNPATGERKIETG
jgi:hypothetical protein